MTQADLIKLAEDLATWLTEMSVKYNIDENTLQEIIKNFLTGAW